MTDKNEKKEKEQKREVKGKNEFNEAFTPEGPFDVLGSLLTVKELSFLGRTSKANQAMLAAHVWEILIKRDIGPDPKKLLSPQEEKEVAKLKGQLKKEKEAKDQELAAPTILRLEKNLAALYKNLYLEHRKLRQAMLPKNIHTANGAALAHLEYYFDWRAFTQKDIGPDLDLLLTPDEAKQSEKQRNNEFWRRVYARHRALILDILGPGGLVHDPQRAFPDDDVVIEDDPPDDEVEEDQDPEQEPVIVIEGGNFAAIPAITIAFAVDRWRAYPQYHPHVLMADIDLTNVGYRRIFQLVHERLRGHPEDINLFADYFVGRGLLGKIARDESYSGLSVLAAFFNLRIVAPELFDCIFEKMLASKALPKHIPTGDFHTFLVVYKGRLTECVTKYGGQLFAFLEKIKDPQLFGIYFDAYGPFEIVMRGFESMASDAAAKDVIESFLKFFFSDPKYFNGVFELARGYKDNSQCEHFINLLGKLEAAIPGAEYVNKAKQFWEKLSSSPVREVTAADLSKPSASGLPSGVGSSSTIFSSPPPSPRSGDDAKKSKPDRVDSKGTEADARRRERDMQADDHPVQEDDAEGGDLPADLPSDQTPSGKKR